jgi:pSer/pThr/pTyr-binding forkhead associated (FHA) protein
MNTPIYKIELLHPTMDFRKNAIIPIFKQCVTIGRAEGSTLQYTNEWSAVSRVHAEISYENGKLYIVPKHSTNNKTYVNGKEVFTKTKISDNTNIQVSKNGPSFVLYFKEQRRGFALEGIDVLIAISALTSLILLYFIIKII